MMTAPPDLPGRSAAILRLSPPVVLHVDAEPLLRLQAAQGTQAAQLFVARAREDLMHRLDQAALLYRRGAIAALGAEARGIALTAHPVGLVDLALVAGHVAACCGRDDPVALAATAARLTRLGVRALDLIAALRLPEV